MALTAKKVFAILRKNIKSLASGVKKVSQKDLHTIEFETNDGNKFDITISAGVIDVQFDTTTSILTINYADGTTSDIDLTPVTSESKKIEIQTPTDTWNVQHNLNTPWDELTIQIVDSDGNITNGDIDKDNCTDNLLVIKFREPIAGKIIIKK